MFRPAAIIRQTHTNALQQPQCNVLKGLQAQVVECCVLLVQPFDIDHEENPSFMAWNWYADEVLLRFKCEKPDHTVISTLLLSCPGIRLWTRTPVSFRPACMPMLTW